MNNIEHFIKAWKNGRESGYPWCCVLHYSLIAGLTENKSLQAMHRGGMEHDGEGYVGCIWHGRKGVEYPYNLSHIDEEGVIHLVAKDTNVKEFFDKYVRHEDDCEKGITSETCTCGLMKNLPRIFSLALEGERLARADN